MTSDFDNCLKNQRIREFSPGKALVGKEIAAAENDLETARKSFGQQGYKWATIQCYYSMFHSARALLYAKSYREKSHHCLIIALRALYVDKKLLPVSLVESLQQAKRLREEADYYDTWSQDGAGLLLTAAEKFLEITRGLTAVENKGERSGGISNG